MKRSTKKVELPQSFADQLLQCQIQYKLGLAPSQSTTRKLLQLYVIGVEHYESIKSRKFIYFQQKMKQIFKDIQKLSQKCQDIEKDKQKLEDGTYPTETAYNKKLASFIEVRDHKLQKLTNMDLVKRIINESSLKNIQAEIILKKQLEMQDQRLKQKLQKRKQKTMQKCLSETSAGLTNDLSSRSSIDTQCYQINLNINLNLKPLKASFADIIDENQSDDEEFQNKKNNLKLQLKSKSELGI